VTSAFLIIGVIGLVVLAVSLVLGDILDGAFDALTGDVFSSAVVGGFVAAFGFGGALMEGIGTPTLVNVLVGAGAGVLAGWFTIWLTGLVRDGGSDGTLESQDALGRSGRVISHIPADGFGTVRVLIGGHTVQLNARSASEIAQGTEVHVTEVLSPTAVLVAPVWNELTGTDVPEPT
jgi:membrane-bound ClpP family serine protease